ncbi:MAG TPA: C-type lectin domain-containing protein [Polyangiaceae bacterium]|nr:C-type lectin domain-containing protein [Polyangiaceae bacterium]
MVERSVRTPGARLDATTSSSVSRIPRHAAQVLTLLVPWALTGCPLSDNYFVDPNYNVAGGLSQGGGRAGLGGNAGTGGGAAAAGMSAGGAVAGGSGGSGAAVAGTGGTGGAGTGGDTTLGGTGGTGAFGGGSGGGDAGQAGGGPEGGAAGEGSCVPEPELCDGKSNGCDGAVDEGVCPEHCSAQQHDGRVYVLCVWGLAANGADYETAEARCAGMGKELGLDGDFTLAFVESADENDFLKEWIRTKTSVGDGAIWIGANDIGMENTWVWGQGPDAVQFFRGLIPAGGVAVMGRFNDFGPGRPNGSNLNQEDCGAFDAEAAWRWNDRQCANSEIGFVCEQQP